MSRAVILAAFYLDLHQYLRRTPADLDQALAQELQSAKMPGAAVAVIKDNRVVFSQGYGKANIAEGRKAAPHTLFTIASVSKIVTMTTLMHLYDEGRFQLDDDINRYLPFPVRNPHYPDMPITFRMLLAHTSSILDSPVYNQQYNLHLLGQPPDAPLGLQEYVKGPAARRTVLPLRITSARSSLGQSTPIPIPATPW